MVPKVSIPRVSISKAFQKSTVFCWLVFSGFESKKNELLKDLLKKLMGFNLHLMRSKSDQSRYQIIE